MGKRKRDEGAEEADGGISIKQRRINHKLKLATSKLGHAFKVAKGFERQKLGRRRKTAEQNNLKDVERIEFEITALKALDTTSHAKQHLYKSLLKIKAVSDHRDLPPQVKKPITIPTDTATLNVNARLCKSNPVKEALGSASDEIQSALGLELERSGSKKKRRVRAEDFDASAQENSAARLERGSDRVDANPLPSAPSHSRAVEDDYESEDNFAALDDRVALSSNETDDGALEVDQLERQLAFEGIQRNSTSPRAAGYSLEADLSMARSESESRSASPEPRKAPTTKKTSFVPSLTMGGYISGSGSEVEDDIDMAPRKNRRGQRARQQIWEQKYGSKAKHLQRQDRKNGWDPKRGATDGGRFGGPGRSSRGTRASPDFNVGGMKEHPSSRPVNEGKKKQPDDTGPIHPSWEAAKRAKEKKDVPVAFQGKKTTFD